MKKTIRFLTLTLFFCFLAVPVMAQQSIAIVDVDQLLSESEAGKSVQSQHTKKREGFQKEFTALENKLMESQKALVNEKDKLSPEEFAKKREALQKELQETGRLFQKRRNALDKGLADAFKTLRKIIIQTTAEVSEEKKFDIVVTRESVVIVDKKMDITDEVLARMNQKVTSIPLAGQ
ncbi:MAG: OmpH family outer membrane protein [Alphaproteobacteria bacterium]|nr:OmpH family outer membrane protein [Alphaproteobacteria bacterium]NCQ88069.1 OmpH family outer membrane protein [Alphaproteobacteria bacterium]NCT05424.1 OmpH family outer membrane protein [Alphaproteobacteria bacterium]